MRGMDVFLAFPAIVLALLIVGTVGPKLWLIVLAVGLGPVSYTHLSTCRTGWAP